MEECDEFISIVTALNTRLLQPPPSANDAFHVQGRECLIHEKQIL